jgi:hypothetical protein
MANKLAEAKKLITEHIAMVDADIKNFIATERYELCAELTLVKKGLTYALEDISSLEEVAQ